MTQEVLWMLRLIIWKRNKIYHLSSPSIEISSNDIRKRCSNGSSIHFFLPEDVIDYIERNDLYGSTADRRKA